jgi:hypothetical protein
MAIDKGFEEKLRLLEQDNIYTHQCDGQDRWGIKRN